MNTGQNALSPEALDANRAGRLTDDQRQVWRRMDRGRRQGVRGVAWVFCAMGLILLFADGGPANAATRRTAGMLSLALGGAVVLGSIFVPDGLRADAGEGRVEAIEGAIARHTGRTSTGRAGRRIYYLDVAGRSFRTNGHAYEAAPEAGIVRLFYLPRTRRVVNFERLPDRPLPAGGPMEVVKQVAGALRQHDRTAMAEARASGAALVAAITAQMHDTAAPPPDRPTDPRALADSLIGSWRNPLMTVTFSADGTATLTTLLGAARRGRWSVDVHGRLVTDATGETATAEAWIAGDRLTIAMAQEKLTFTRVHAA